MTAYVVFDALRQKRVTLSQPVTISENASRAPGSRMFLDPGKSVAIEDLLAEHVHQQIRRRGEVSERDGAVQRGLGKSRGAAEPDE